MEERKANATARSQAFSFEFRVASYELECLPALGDAEVHDVSYVVFGVPGVEEGGFVVGHGATFGVLDAALPLGFVEGLEEHDPAGVETFDDLERPLGGCGGGVVEHGEELLVVAGHGGPVFGEGFAEAVEGRHVRVGDMVDELADGPSAFAIGRVDLRGVEVAERFAEQLGHLGDGLDGFAEVFGVDGGGRLEVADGVAWVGSFGHDFLPE